MRLSKRRLIIGTYLLIAFVFVPLLTPLRQLQAFSAGIILMGTIPFVVLLSTTVLGKRLLIMRSYLSLALIFTVAQAALVGLGNAADGEIRSYLSHLFQLSSAFVMLAVGAHWSESFGEKFWRRIAILTLFAASISSMISIRLWDAGDISRFYTPAYNLIFVVAFGLAVSPQGKVITLVSIFTAIISNKRGPLLSIVSMFFTKFFFQLGVLQRLHSKINPVALIGFLFIIISATITILVAAPQNIFEGSPIVRAIEETVDRLLDIFALSQNQYELNAIMSGRLEEINLGLDSIKGIELLIGNGAGWTAFRGSGAEIQNIHVTPLSLVVVFGLPFAAFFYLYWIFLLMRSLRPCLSNGSVTEKMAIYYLAGSLVHSLVAYSIFIDLLNFFFIGVLVNATSRHWYSDQRHVEALT